ncbi:MAG: radical SAM protein [Promethearchaeota archaeon]|nr:MAG: radical SAM protein [Candidatus Lokiarchaeota archaeon]
MSSHIQFISKDSQIPLFGVDFLGIIDRGTNVIEVKPLTLCNLQCKYCFVSAGDYQTDFIVDEEYLLEKLREVISIKGAHDLEIHIAPYGESLLYPFLDSFITHLSEMEGIRTISMQSNGLLLTKERISRLENAGLTRINISLNSLNQELASYLCNAKNYNMERLLDNIDALLDSSINVLIAPVWFPGENDEDMEEIVNFVKHQRKKGYSEQELQIGIQKYLIYKTGRKLKKIRPKSWGYFYQQLAELEEKYGLKLKLGPKDFGIHPRPPILSLDLKKGQIISATIVSEGRWEYECIGAISDHSGIKILLPRPWKFTPKLLGKTIQVKIIKANYKDNILTAIMQTLF